MAVIKKIVIPCLVILGIIVLFVSVRSCTTSNMFYNWKAETKAVPYVKYTTVYYDNKQLNMETLIDTKGKSHLEEVFAIYNSRIYFCYSTRYPDDDFDTFLWNIASVDKNNVKNIIIHYTAEFGTLSNTSDHYNKAFTNHYYDKSGFYYNGKIVLKDLAKLVEYDIEKDSITLYSPDEYNYPSYDYEYSIQNDNNEVLLRSSENNYEKLITLETMASNQYGAKLLEVRDEPIWDKNFKKAAGFFQNVQFIDKEVYLIGRVYNYRGDVFPVVFKYDVINDKYEYVISRYFGDNINYDFYLIECVER